MINRGLSHYFHTAKFQLQAVNRAISDSSWN